MLFTSIFFLTLFLPLFLSSYYLCPAIWRNRVALVFSLFFYLWGAPQFLPVVLVVGAGNYWLSHHLGRSSHRRLWLGLGIGIHLAILFYYKYLLFFSGQLSLLLTMLEAPFSLPKLPEILLPLGVSFITFEQISYLMDVYRGDGTPARKLTDYWLFLLLFPHSIAGPIFRWKDLDGQIQHRDLQTGDIFNGFFRFIYGLGKKAVIANIVAFPSDQIYSLPKTEVGFWVSWIAAIGYMLQIYFDFSAYSDMAIGIGQMIGFSFKENFLFPYTANSITDFWKRWHISLTSWFRLYLYIPLGGNRVGEARTYLNVFFVFLVSGLWHGSSWHFVIWGAFHGILILIERFFKISFGAFATFVLVLLGWVLFRATDMGQATTFFRAMAGLSGNPTIITYPFAQILPYRCLVTMVIGLAMIPFEPKIYAFLENNKVGSLVRWTFAGAVYLMAMAGIANSTYNPFIYFRF